MKNFIAQGDKELVEVLLEGNASPLAVASDGSTAYSLALSSGRKLVAFLIAEAASLHSIESQNLNSLLESLQNGSIPLLNELVCRLNYRIRHTL